MVIAIVFNSDGSPFSGAIRNDISLEKLKNIKEVNERKCFEITDQQAIEIGMGGVAAESGGIVTVTDSLSPYKQKIKSQLRAQGQRAGLRIWPLLDQVDANGNGGTALTNKKLFRQAQKAEWAKTKQDLLDATDKAAIDLITPNWPRNPKP